MRLIEHDKGQIKRSADAPQSSGGVLHFVDEQGSAAIVGGQLYIDGQPAAQGQHRLTLRDGDLIIDVDAHGKAAHRVERRGGGNGGPGR